MRRPLIRRRGGNMASIQTFLIASTCFLYLVAAGLFSKAIGFFGNNEVSHLPSSQAWPLTVNSGTT